MSKKGQAPALRLRFRSLASGSAANATLVEGWQDETVFRALVDCGMNLRQLEKRLAEDALSISELDAVFVTHEHTDHVGCCFELARKRRIPIWASHGTYQGAGAPDAQGMWQVARDGEAFEWGCGLRVTPFTVPHDAREPLQLRISAGAASLALVTDLGHITDHVLEHVQDCQALLLESNHDPAMLARSRYPEFLKRRIGGRHGHLANAVAAQLLAEVRHPGLRHVVAAHLSQQNNHPDLARQALAGGLGWHADDVLVASQEAGCAWVEVGLPRSSCAGVREAAQAMRDVPARHAELADARCPAVAAQ